MASLIRLARARYTLPLLALSALGLAGCYNQPIEAQISPADESEARSIFAQAGRYCLEEGYQQGTAHFDECVKNKAIKDAIELKLLQQAASGQYAAAPPPVGNVYVVTPTPTSCVPDVRGMSAGAAFAAGLRGC